MRQLARAPILYRPDAGNFFERDAGQGAAVEAVSGQAGFAHCRLLAADVGWQQAVRESDAGSGGDLRGLKAIAKGLERSGGGASQLSRAPESRSGDHRPQPGGFARVGVDQQDADLVMFIFREEIYKQDDPDLQGRAEIIIAKQRNGPIGG